MRKQLVAICLMSLCLLNCNPVYTTAEEETATEEEIIDLDYLNYHVEDATDGFCPPQGETIQFQVRDMIIGVNSFPQGFQRRSFLRNAFWEKELFRIANPVEKLPCGQHHRYTLLTNGEEKQTVFWYSSQPEVASIDVRTGELTANTTGSTWIWVTNQAGIVLDGSRVEIIPELTKEEVEWLYMRPEMNIIGPYLRWSEFESLKELLLPEDVVALRNCFENERLRQVRIPASVKVIAYDLSESEEWGIRHGKKVTFSVDGNNTNYYSIDGVLFSYPFYSTKDPMASYISLVELLTMHADCGKTALLVYPTEREAEEYYVPVGVERIAGRAFEGARYLRRVVLADTVTHIGGDAFGACVNLEEIVIPASVTVFEDNGWVEALDSWSMNGVTIVTPAGSAAEAYAIEHGFDYRNE